MNYWNRLLENATNKHTFTLKWWAAVVVFTVLAFAALSAIYGVVALIIWTITIIPASVTLGLALLIVLFAAILAGS